MDLANKPPPPASQLNPREAVDLIERLIELKESNLTNHLAEQIELTKRQLTDYFLAADGRKGIYVKGPNDG